MAVEADRARAAEFKAESDAIQARVQQMADAHFDAAVQAESITTFLTEANKCLGLADSVSRLKVMMVLFEWRENHTDGLDPNEFWRVFLDNWFACDGVAEYAYDVERRLLDAKSYVPASTFYNAEALAFFDALPAMVTVYRGCSREHVDGICWTRSRKTAEFFASGHRFPVVDPIVATGRVRKERIYAVLTDRKESEVLCRPKVIKVEPFSSGST
jgi:hypothetical protein